MNRRKFVLASSISLALAGNRATAQRSSRGSASSVITSEFTGATVDFSNSNLELRLQHIATEEEGSEHVHFTVPPDGRFDIIFWQHELGDARGYPDLQIRLWSATFGNEFEMIAEDEYDDGGWMAFEVAGKLGYYEYQRGAYPGHDLVTLLEAEKSVFLDAFENAQAILVDELVPMLFIEDSGILGIAANRSEASASTGSGRTSRSSSATDKNEADTDDDAATRGTNSTATGDSPVEAVLEHRIAFLDSFARFDEFLKIVGSDTATDAESSTAFAGMANVSLEWQQYPDQAADVVFSSEFADLESAYIDWAAGIGEMGFSFEQFFMGAGELDVYLDAFDAWSLADDELLAVLEGYVSAPRRHLAARGNGAKEIANRMTALRG